MDPRTAEHSVGDHPESVDVRRPVADEIASRLALGESGPPILVVLGDVGVGKTRAIRQASRDLEAAGVRIGAGEVRHPAAMEVDLDRPVMEAVADAVNEGYEAATGPVRNRIAVEADDVLNSLAIAGGAAALLFPPLALAGLLAGIPQLRNWRSRRRSEDSVSDSDVLATVAHLLKALGAPSVLHLGDAQWLAPESVSLCAGLAREAMDTTRIVLEVRSQAGFGLDDATEIQILADVRELQLDGLAESLEVPPFTDAEVATFLDQRFGDHDLGRDFMGGLRRLTGGRPMFIDLVLESLVATGQLAEYSGAWGPRPGFNWDEAIDLRGADDLRTLLAMTWDQLSANEQTVLSVAALAGGPVTPDQIAAGAGLDELAAAQNVDQLCRKRLLRERPADETFVVSHALWQAFATQRTTSLLSRAIHRRLAERAEPRSLAAAHHLLLAGDHGAALAGAEQALEAAVAGNDWLETEFALGLLRAACGGELPDRYLPQRALQLTRTGRAREALVLVQEHPELLRHEHAADLVHLSGNYAAAAGQLRSRLDEDMAHDQEWRMRLRLVHHLKFIDPTEAEREFAEHLSVESAPSKLRALTMYTLHGSLCTLFRADSGTAQALRDTAAEAEREGDLDTLAKALRKLGEIECFVLAHPDAAEAAWKQGLEAAEAIRSRQALYLEVVSYWREFSDGEAAELDRFYRRCARRFRQLAIPGWEAHSELLLAEALRSIYHTRQSVAAARRARDIYDQLGMTWGRAAARLAEAFSSHNPAGARTAVSLAAQHAHSDLAKALPESPLPLLLP